MYLVNQLRVAQGGISITFSLVGSPQMLLTQQRTTCEQAVICHSTSIVNQNIIFDFTRAEKRTWFVFFPVYTARSALIKIENKIPWGKSSQMTNFSNYSHVNNMCFWNLWEFPSTSAVNGPKMLPGNTTYNDGQWKKTKQKNKTILSYKDGSGLLTYLLPFWQHFLFMLWRKKKTRKSLKPPHL